MGTPDFAVPVLDVLIKNTNVVLVITKPDNYVGRKKVLTMTPVKLKALDNNISVIEPHKMKDAYSMIKDINPDLIVTCAYGKIVPKEILDIPRLGCINVHASLLPKYRGGAPIHHAIINGEDTTGITIMYMNEGLDTGDIIAMKSIPITNEDNVETMHDKLSKLGAELLEEVLPSIIDGTNERIAQNDKEASFAPTIKREDEHLDFDNKARDIYNKVRGLNSWPLANMILDGEEIKVIEGYIGEDTKEKPGKIIDIKKDAIGISSRDKIFYITKIKPFGKKIMLVRDYLNGIDKEKLMNIQVK